MNSDSDNSALDNDLGKEDDKNTKEEDEKHDAELAMKTMFVFDWSKVVGVMTTYKHCMVYFDNGTTANVQVPFFLEGNTEALLTKQFRNYLDEKKAKEISLYKKFSAIEEALKYSPNDLLDSEYHKALTEFQTLSGKDLGIKKQIEEKSLDENELKELIRTIIKEEIEQKTHIKED